MCDHIGFEYPSDLDSNLHECFTVGKGKLMYWYVTWLKSGHAYIYRLAGHELVRRWVPGDIEITIHFK